MADQRERERTKRLDTLIQAALGWTDSHLHEFEIAEERYGIPERKFQRLASNRNWCWVSVPNTST
ncbi:IS1096 element passenger TnpR family protein [Burkholderia sp. LMG 21824]|uniref:IS1096 element passenger TnpR family protein n=1 Tax=Burkholderia sp. LMG 21824 TaxID=3158172 RepID=UPI003C2CB186